MICTPNTTKSCYTGPAGTLGVGVCKGGTQTCNAQGTAYGPCVGEVTPTIENCATPADEDCNGSAPPCSGTPVWAKCFGGMTDQEGNYLALDPAGNILLAGYSSEPIDYGCGVMQSAAGDTPILVKFDPQGNCLWSHVFTIPQLDVTDQVRAVASDSAGNVYIVVTFFGSVDLGGGVLASTGASDVAIAKFDPNGVHQWSKRFGNGAAQTGTTMAVDGNGNVIVGGYFAGSIDFGGGALTAAGGNDVFVAKLSSAGAHVWSKRYGDASNQSSNSIAVDAAGNVLVSGSFLGTIDFGGGALTSAGLADAFIAKLDPAGNQIWAKRAGGTADDGTLGVNADPAGNVIATGYFGGGTINWGGANLVNQGNNDMWIVKLDPSGNHVWSKSAGGVNNQGGHIVAADAFGNIGLIGSFNASIDLGGGALTSAGAIDIFAAKYDPTGKLLWSKQAGSVGSDLPRHLVVDAAGNGFITGLTNGPADFGSGPVCGFGGEDTFLVKLGP